MHIKIGTNVRQKEGFSAFIPNAFPPKGILDLSYDRSHRLERCGCSALRNHILNRIKPRLCLFGHIHNRHDIINAGTLKLSDYDTVFSNGSVVTDGKFGRLSSNGNILEI